MSELTLVEAINDCFHVELARDEAVMVMGEDIGRAGGVFRATAGLRDRYGPDRCVDTPLAEAGIVGTAVGLCMAGWRPVCELQYDAFSYPGLDQLITHVGRYRWRTGGKMTFPLTIRMPYGGGVKAPELHDDSPEAYYVHTPGVKVTIPSTPADAKGLLAAAIRSDDPVVVLEPKLHYRTMRGDVPEGEHVVPLGKARIAREGSDVTLVAYGSMVPLSEQVAEALAGEASVEVLDVRTLKPLDEDALLASAAKTGRVVIVQEAPRTAGYGAELAAILAEKAILDLRGPVLRVTGYDVPYPYWQIEDAYMPSVERVSARGQTPSALARAGRSRLPAPRRGDGRARPLGGRAHPRRAGGRRLVPARGARRPVVRARPPARTRARARERARPERGRDLERRAQAPGRLRARRGRARAAR
jgi:pyruvate dehydrogenase E1 component beta subunit